MVPLNFDRVLFTDVVPLSDIATSCRAIWRSVDSTCSGTRALHRSFVYLQFRKTADLHVMTTRTTSPIPVEQCSESGKRCLSDLKVPTSTRRWLTFSRDRRGRRHETLDIRLWDGYLPRSLRQLQWHTPAAFIVVSAASICCTGSWESFTVPPPQLGPHKCQPGLLAVFDHFQKIL